MNCYKVLGITVQATAEEIKSAYRKHAKKTHPDVAGRGKQNSFQQVSEAYETLNDPHRREQWEQRYRREAEAMGCHVCGHCFAMVRVRPFTQSETPKCGDCLTPLKVEPDQQAAYRQAIARQFGDLIETIGAEGASFAKDAILSGASALRRKLGIPRSK